MKVERILEDIQLRTGSLWAVANDPLCRNLLTEYRRYNALIPTIEQALPLADDPDGIMRFERFFKTAYAEPTNYEDAARWALYWSVVCATHTIQSLVHQASHEPELNGALLSAIASEVKKARAHVRARNAGDLLAVNFSNLAARGNEARTGGDFGVIIERRVKGERRYWAALIQAKRAQSPKVDIHREAGDTTQRALLEAAERGVRAYLFYNEFGDYGLIPPTVLSVELLKNYKTDLIHTLEHGQDFAAWFAFGFPSGSVVGPQVWTNPGDALRCIFRSGSGTPQPVVNDLLVALLGDEELAAYEVNQFERDWKVEVDKLRGGHRSTSTIATHRGDSEGSDPVEG